MRLTTLTPIVLALALAGCGADNPAGPSPLPLPGGDASPAGTVGSTYTGDWLGLSSQGRVFSMRVWNDRVTHFWISYVEDGYGACYETGVASLTIAPGAPISSWGSVSIPLTPTFLGSPYLIGLQGTFTSPSTFQGTVTLKHVAALCPWTLTIPVQATKQ